MSSSPIIPSGVNGTNGADGADGADGAGVPVGGTANQLLAKTDGTDYNTEWQDKTLATYASFYTTTGGITAIAGTAQTLVIASTRNSRGTWTLATNQITVGQTGIYLLTADFYINSGGTTRSEYGIWLERGGVEETASRSATYQRGYDSGQSATISMILSVTSGDVLRFRTALTESSGTTGYQDDNGTRVSFLEII